MNAAAGVFRHGILRSARMRLAVWHTAVLALVLVAFTGATYAFLERLTEERIDRLLQEAVESFHHVVLLEMGATRTPVEAAVQAAREFRFSGRRVLVYGPHHSPIAVSDAANDSLTQAISAIDEADDSPLHPLFTELTPGHSAFATIGHGGGDVRAYATRFTVGNDPLTIVALQIGPDETTVVASFLKSAGVAIPLALTLAGVGGYALARRSFAPAVQMGRQASQISSEHFDARLAVRGTGDEMDELATVFNDMLSRLSAAFVQQRQFVADASHELRTPIATLRAETSVALSQRRTPEEYERSLQRVLGEARRLSGIVDDLITMALLDTSKGVLQREDFYVEELLLECTGRLRLLAASRGVAIEFHPASEARASGDPVLIERVVTNLLDNAIKYTAPGGRVHVDLESRQDLHVVRVRDTGSGIPEAAQPYIFDRFFRADAARARAETSTNGVGLGLSIARQIALAHGGSLELTASSPHGTTFTFTLPAAPEPMLVPA